MKKKMVKKPHKTADYEMIEIGYSQSWQAVHGPLASEQGRFFDKYEYRAFLVPKAVAENCRRLDARRDCGVHIANLGGLDALADLDFWNVPFRAIAKPDRGTGNRACWITPSNAVFRFAEGAPNTSRHLN